MGFDIGKIGEWIATVENQIAQSGESDGTNLNNKIDTNKERSIFAQQLQKATQDNDLSNKDAAKIWGLYVENQAANDVKSTSQLKNSPAKVADGGTYSTEINITNNITINLTVEIDFKEAIKDLLEGQEQAIQELIDFFKEYLESHTGLDNQEFLEEFIKNILYAIVGEMGLGEINQLLTQILEQLELANTKIDNLEATIIKMAEDNLKYYNNMNVKMDDLLALVQTSAENQEKQIEMLNLITQVLNKLSENTSQFYTQISNDLNVLIGLVQDNKMSMQELMEVLKAIEADTSKNAQVSQEILAEIVKGNETSEKILEAITLMNAELAELSNEVKSGVLAILTALVEQGASMDDIKKLLAEIKADTSENNRISLLILDAIKNLGADVAGSLTTILDAINNVNVSGGGDNTQVIQLLEKILKQIEQNGEANKEGFKAVIDAISTLGIDIAGQMTQILDAINKQEENSEAIKVLLEQILAQAQLNGAENKEGFKAVLDAIANIPPAEAVDIGNLETLLVEIKNLLQGNNEKLDTVITNENTIIMILNSFKAEVLAYLDEFGTEGEAIKDRLDILIAKLENGQCDCDVDGAALMDMLQKILDAIKNHKCECDCGGSTGGNNEGILNDLSTILNAPKHDSTGIETVKYNNKEYKVGTKILINGEVLIVGKDGLYDVSGRLVEKF